MRKLTCGMMISLDGYYEDQNGRFGLGAPEIESVHAYANRLAEGVVTYLDGRRMYEVMLYWETAENLPDSTPVELEWARQWKAADKIVFSRTLTEVQSERTEIRREFDPEWVRRLKSSTPGDIAIAGPTLAGEAARAGLIDELQLIVCPVLVGSGKRFFTDDVGAGLSLLEQRALGSGVIGLRYAVGG